MGFAFAMSVLYHKSQQRLSIAYCRVNDLITSIHDKLDIHGKNELKSFVRPERF